MGAGFPFGALKKFWDQTVVMVARRGEYHLMPRTVHFKTVPFTFRYMYFNTDGEKKSTSLERADLHTGPQCHRAPIGSG